LYQKQSKMEKKSVIYLFPILQNRELYPKDLGKVLGMFFTSNQKYFTIEEMERQTLMNKTNLNSALDLLVKQGNINTIALNSDRLSPLFYFDAKSSFLRLQMNIAENRLLLELLEKVVIMRGASNVELNEFIKNTIAFNSEVLDFIDKTSKEYFKGQIKF